MFLELRYFAPDSLSTYFPASRIWLASRPCSRPIATPRGYSRPRDCQALRKHRRDSTPKARKKRLRPPSRRSRLPTFRRKRAARRLLDKANRIGARGNLVRAASMRIAAARRGTPNQATRGLDRAQHDMERTADRLQPALGFDDGERVTWVRLLMVLAINSGHAIWSNEMRLLYDLQKVCIDHERGVYKLDICRWIVSALREPLKRPLPAKRDVLMARHLRRATQRLPSIRVSPWAARRLRKLLQVGLAPGRDKVRTRFRPVIETALNRAKLRRRTCPRALPASSWSTSFWTASSNAASC